jgi:hypothetical protein
MTKLPRWVLNTLRAKSDYDATWLHHIQVNSHEFNDGCETVTIVVARRFEMKLRRVTGRNYADRAQMHCFECEHAVTQPAGIQLRACGNVDCRVLLCQRCIKNHETLHELAGEEILSPWDKST